ncbi:MAG: hypothetical protein HZA91_08765 [Verrucomicrobia bacterium]|nr:hypothetical protein [Verrucomicrobiota bacterium]
MNTRDLWSKILMIAGGITVPMLLGSPIVFIIGAVGAIVCLIKGSKAKDRSTP